MQLSTSAALGETLFLGTWAALLEVSGRLPRADRRRPVTAGRASAGRRLGRAGHGLARPAAAVELLRPRRSFWAGPRSPLPARPPAALTGPSVLPLSFAGSTRSPSRGGGAAALQVWPEVAKAVGPSCACQVRGRVPPQSDAGLGWSPEPQGPLRASRRGQRRPFCPGSRSRRPPRDGSRAAARWAIQVDAH